MGDPDEKPVHTVHLDAFYIDKYEVTVAQYKHPSIGAIARRQDGVANPLILGSFLLVMASKRAFPLSPRTTNQGAWISLLSRFPVVRLLSPVEP